MEPSRKAHPPPRRWRRIGHLLALLGLALAASPSGAVVYAGALDAEHDAAAVDQDPTAQIHCLALNVYHEARGEPHEGKLAVAMVTLNRVRSEQFPETVCRVVWQPGQFSWTKDGRADTPRNPDAWDEALWLATWSYHLQHSPVVGDATYFHAVDVRPYWTREKRRVGRVGRHVFYESVPR